MASAMTTAQQVGQDLTLSTLPPLLPAFLASAASRVHPLDYALVLGLLPYGQHLTFQHLPVQHPHPHRHTAGTGRLLAESDRDRKDKASSGKGRAD